MNGKEVIAKYGDRVPENIRRYWERDRPIEMKPVFLTHYTSREKLPPMQQIWIRATGPVPDDRATQSVILAYLSDMTLLDTSTFAHGRALFDPDIQAASLDHAMWFHRPHRLDGWLLYAQDSPSASGARGFTRGADLCARTERWLPRLHKKDSSGCAACHQTRQKSANA